MMAAHHAWRTLLIYPDESNVILPAMNWEAGGAVQASKHPTFPAMFYGAFLRVFSHVSWLAGKHPIYLSRIANTGLFVLNAALFFWAAHPLLGRAWALAAVCLFSLGPGIFFSGVIIKTESLLMAEILAALGCTSRIIRAPRVLRWHGVSALACGLAVATKFHVFTLAAYGVAAALGQGRERKEGGKGLLDVKGMIVPLGVFTVIFLATVLCAWTTWRDLGGVWAHVSSTAYFSDYPTLFRSVPGPGAFPFGRFSYPLVFVIPATVGAVVYLLGLAGLFLGGMDRRMLAPWLGYSVIYTAAVCSISLLRPFNLFLPIAPLFALAAAAFLKRAVHWAVTGARKAAVSALLLATLSTTWLLHSDIVGIHETAQKSMAIARNYVKEHSDSEGDLMELLPFSIGRGTALDARRLDREIVRLKPKYILLLDSYIFNYCKQDEQAGYGGFCAFFQALMQGRGDYRILWVSGSRTLLQKIFFFDPECSHSYYFFQRLPEAG